MKEFINKLIESLEEYPHGKYEDEYGKGFSAGINASIEEVNELAEEYKDKSNIIDDLKTFLQEKFDYCAEQAGMNLEAECNSEIASYFRERKELYLDRANIYGEVISVINRLAEEYINTSTDTSSGWIACSERLPDIEGNTSDTVLVCTIDGFQHMAFWCADETWRYCASGMIKEPMEWTKIIAWMPLPAPYKEGVTENE